MLGGRPRPDDGAGDRICVELDIRIESFQSRIQRWRTFYANIIAINWRYVSILILELYANIESNPVERDSDRISFRGHEGFPRRNLHFRFRKALTSSSHPYAIHFSNGTHR